MKKGFCHDNPFGEHDLWAAMQRASQMQLLAYTILTKVFGCLTITPTGTVMTLYSNTYTLIWSWSPFCSYNSFHSSWKAFHKCVCGNWLTSEMLYRINGHQFPQKHSKLLWKAFQEQWNLL